MLSVRVLLLCLLGPALAVKHLRNATRQLSLRASSGGSLQKPGCTCEANNAFWQRTARTQPKCIFIDLGAADGNTFANFLQDDFGPVRNCPHGGEWEAFLVEANPMFTRKLEAIQANLPGKVHAFPATAAYSCETHTSFSIDADPTHNHWGSSLVERVGLVEVTVPTINVNKFIAEHVIKEDWVMLKVDIEGAEYDVIPCLAEFQDAGLVDRMFLEEHWWFPDRTVAQNSSMLLAKTMLREKHVDIPMYYSPSL